MIQVMSDSEHCLNKNKQSRQTQPFKQVYHLIVSVSKIIEIAMKTVILSR